MPLNETFPTIHLRDYPEYTPRNTLELTLQSAAVSAGFGVLAAAIKNSLRMGKGHIGALHPQTGFLTFLFGKSDGIKMEKRRTGVLGRKGTVEKGTGREY